MPGGENASVWYGRHLSEWLVDSSNADPTAVKPYEKQLEMVMALYGAGPGGISHSFLLFSYESRNVGQFRFFTVELFFDEDTQRPHVRVDGPHLEFGIRLQARDNRLQYRCLERLPAVTLTGLSVNMIKLFAAVIIAQSPKYSRLGDNCHRFSHTLYHTLKSVYFKHVTAESYLGVLEREAFAMEPISSLLPQPVGSPSPPPAVRPERAGSSPLIRPAVVLVQDLPTNTKAAGLAWVENLGPMAAADTVARLEKKHEWVTMLMSSESPRCLLFTYDTLLDSSDGVLSGRRRFKLSFELRQSVSTAIFEEMASSDPDPARLSPPCQLQYVSLVDLKLMVIVTLSRPGKKQPHKLVKQVFDALQLLFSNEVPPLAWSPSASAVPTPVPSGSAPALASQSMPAPLPTPHALGGWPALPTTVPLPSNVSNPFFAPLPRAMPDH
jgi:hypothetical protein